tara:strand:- start:554 stop:805 length:252 start_codon:yes stop_codon:yes gene_type:complete
MKQSQRLAVGRKVARLVVEAEARFPGRGTGPKKRAWVLREARKDAPKGTGPSADFASYMGRFLLKICLEACVAALQFAKGKLP